MQKLKTKLIPLKRISPSRYTTIKRCPYKVVLSNSYDSPLLPYPPASHLGHVIHECIRYIITNEIKTFADFDDVWNFLISKEEGMLRKKGLAHFIPLIENVPGYTIKKLQVKSLLNSHENRGGRSGKNRNIRTLSEKWLESKDLLIGGYADLITNIEGYIKLSDFKSGKIHTEEGIIKEEYEDQLKLYAYLYNEVYGKYPDELSLIDLNKKEYSIIFTPNECEELGNKSRKALLNINKLIEIDEIEALSNPNAENCKNCLYRPACNFYWNPIVSKSESIFRDIKGYVIGVKQFRNGNLNVILHKDDHELVISHLNKEYMHFLSTNIGKQVAFYNVKQGEMLDSYRALKTTKVYEA